jgi:hypothetical protein
VINCRSMTSLITQFHFRIGINHYEGSALANIERDTVFVRIGQNQFKSK